MKFPWKAVFATFIYNLYLNCLWENEWGDNLSHEVVLIFWHLEEKHKCIKTNRMSRENWQVTPYDLRKTTSKYVHLF